MAIIPIERLRDHCKADGDDDAQLEFYGLAAEKAVAAHLNRMIFPDYAAMETAIEDIPSAMSDAQASYDAALLSLDEDDWRGRSRADNRYLNARNAQHAILDGIVVSEDIEAAILLTAGHLYRNREATVVGATVASLPNGVDALLAAHRKLPYAP